MTAADVAAVITAAAGLVVALAALVRAWRTQSQLAAHASAHPSSTTTSARQSEIRRIGD